MSHVTGIASGNGVLSGGRYQGIAPCSHIVSLKILDHLGHGSSTYALSAIRWILENAKRYQIRVANLSIGTNDKKINVPLRNAVEELWRNNILVVAAAGNSNGRRNFSPPPPISPSIITVGSWEDKKNYPVARKLGLFSRDMPDVWAGGENIISVLSPDYNFSLPNRSRLSVIPPHYVSMSGTSMATPTVSGMAALLFEQYPRASCDEIKQMLQLLALRNNGFLTREFCKKQGRF